jgi:CIC family chloride channel protein
LALDDALARLRRILRSAPYLRKWVILGAAIGIISGLGAALFFTALEVSTALFLGVLAGFQPATAIGEGGHAITDPTRLWALPLVVAAGGLISGIIVFRFAPEAEGHGTDAAISAFHHRPRGVRGRIPLVKLVSAAVTIGSGGSGGREGPTAQIGAGFGSFLARTLDLEARDARIAVSAGMASGIGAIFRAPLGGAILGVEIPYRDDIEADALVPSFVASIVAFSIFGALIGFGRIFGHFGSEFTDPRQLVYYALIGLTAGLVGRLYISSFYGFTAWFKRRRWPRALKPAIAGFAVGCLGIVLPGVIGTGYGWVQAGLSRESIMSIPLWVIIALPFAKILATSLSIGSGGSGGIFGPGMVVGGLLGAALWRLLVPWAPFMPSDPAPFVIVAMMALFGSVAHSPIAVMLMVAEMTGDLGMLPPAMIAVGIALLIVDEKSIYASQLATRADSPAHKFQFSMPVMATLPAGDAARAARVVVDPGDRADETLRRLKRARLPGAPVASASGSLKGTITAQRLELSKPTARVGDLLGESGSVGIPILSAEDSLDEALGALADSHASWAPVVADGKLAGVLSVQDIMRSYRAALTGSVRRVRGLGSGGALVRATIAAGSALAGHTVARIGWPRDSVLVAVHRGDRLLVPRGDLRLEAGDDLTIFAVSGGRDSLEKLLGAPLSEEEPELLGTTPAAPGSGVARSL